jgi:predicted Zn-dependent protease
MKFRLSVIIAAIVLFGGSATFAQTQSTTDQTVSTGAPQSGQSTSGQSAPADQTPAANSSAQTPAQNTPAPVSEPDPSKVKHDGGKDDVDAIGNRKVGGRGLGDWYSLETEIRMGKQYSMMIESSSKMVNDPVVTEYVNRLGQNIVRNSDAKVPFTIKVIDSDVVNAMALPGGFFYVNSGLILAADEEAELAGVMAHEIAHVCARHAMRQMTRANIANIGTIPLIFVGGGIGYAVYNAAGLAIPMAMLSFQRSFEAEADYLGLQYMYKSGYDPQAFVAFFEKIEALEKKKPGSIEKAFSTHPQTPDRIEASQKEIATILPARQEYTVTTSEFDEVKARLAAIENRRKMVDHKDGNKPSLRRASSTDKNGNDNKTDDDDRPTLKRRDDSGSN